MSKVILTDRDALMNADRPTVARGCVRIFDSLQGNRREHQVLSMACAFVLLCEVAKVDAQDAFTAAKNLMADPLKSSGRYHQFDAMKFYVSEEGIL